VGKPEHKLQVMDRTIHGNRSVHDTPSNTEWTLQDITQVESALQLQYDLPQRQNISTHYCLYIYIIPVPVHNSPWHCTHFQYYHTHAPFLHGPVAGVLCSDVPDAISEQHHVPPTAGTRCPGLSTLDLRPPYLATLEPCPAVAHAIALPAISNTSVRAQFYAAAVFRTRPTPVIFN
jgi:hypothetical protein